MLIQELPISQDSCECDGTLSSMDYLSVGTFLTFYLRIS